MSFIVGTSSDNTLNGTASADTIQGLGGEDDLSGLAGDDILFGGSGRDVLRGGEGADFLYGGGGNDAAAYDLAVGPIVASLLAGTSSGPDGEDTFLSVEALFGSAFSDRLTGDAGDNLLVGLGGNDVLDGGAGTDIAGYYRAPSAVVVNLATGAVSGGAGTDTLIGIEGATGTAFNDTLTGDAGNNVFEGGGGNDSINGGAGVDTVSYRDSETAVVVNLAAGVSSGGEGSDVLTSIEAVIGSGSGDTLTGNAGDNSLSGAGGEDTLSGGPGNDVLDGGGGFDLADYHLSSGGMTVHLANGSGSGPDGQDVLVGIEGLVGSEFADQLTGDANLNWFHGRGGSDTFDGGGGIDWASYGYGSVAINANLATGVVNVADGTRDTLTNIEAIHGSTVADTVVGSTGDDWLSGYTGNDTLSAGAGFDWAAYRWANGAVTVNLLAGTSSGADGADTLSGFEAILGSLFADTLTGNAQDNAINGRSGNDKLDGGAGIDTAVYSDASGGVTVNLAAGTATGAEGADTLSNFENVLGSESGDTLIGDAKVNTLSGVGGNDVLEGSGGDDTLDGGDGFDFASYVNAAAAVAVSLATRTSSGPDGVDTLIGIEAVFGSAFNDTLTGDDSLNFLRGNVGNDVLDGGDGNDYADYNGAPGAVQVNLATGVVSGADGVDTLIGIEYLRGSAFDDALTGDAGDNWIRGGLGSDTIDGAAGEDWVDFINATNGVFVDLSLGTAQGEGGDALVGIEHVRGSNSDDWIIGTNASNTLRGGTGDDILDGGGGPGRGNGDSADYSDATGPVSVDLGQGIADGPDGHDTLRSIEGVTGSAFADTLVGDAGNNLFRGGAGADIIVGNGGQDIARYESAPEGITANLATLVFTGWAAEDTLTGIAGIYGTDFDDVLVGDAADNAFRGNAGNDTIDGGAGMDVADYRNAPTAVVVNLQAGTAAGGDGDDLLSGIEGVRGSLFDDTLTGDAGDNVLRGREGNDRLDGGAGADVADYGSATWGVTVDLATGVTIGPDGSDTLISIEGITGSDYDDTLAGDAGSNSLTGGSGDDTIDGGDDGIAGGAGTDTALYAGARGGFTVANTGTRFVVTDTGGLEGSDILSGIETLQFSDKAFELVNPPRTAPPDYGKNPGFLFDSVYYLLDNPDLVPTVTLDTALAHYFASGAGQGRAPNSWFDPTYYENKWADLTPLHLDDATLFMHYNLFGVWEGRSAGPDFDTFDGNRYLADWPDVAAYVDANIEDFLGSRTNGAIAHFVIYGAAEQRTAYDMTGTAIDMGYIV